MNEELADKKEPKDPTESPVREYAFEDLAARITSENRHDETDWGRPVGREIW